MYRIISIILIVLFLLLYNEVICQSKHKNNLEVAGKVSGSIVDADSLKSLIGATITLNRAKDSTLVTGAYSDKDGKFTFDNVAFGTYYIKVSYVGFKTKFVNSVVVSLDKPKNKTGKIKLHPQSVETEGVEVTAQREMIQIEPDKQIIYVDKNLTASGGSAIDALKTVPSITVDVDDNIYLRGSQNIKFLIDGKPSNMASADLLDMIPASDVEKIEIITNPSAKYDAEGNAGIINIVLKKDKQLGYRGQASINAGTSDKYNGSLNFNYKTGKFNFFMNYGIKFHNVNGRSDVEQNFYYDDTLNLTKRHQDDYNRGHSNSLRLGIDYDINSKNSITFLTYYHRVDKDIFKNRQYYDYNNSLQFYDYHTKIINNDNNNTVFDFDLSYKLKFDKKDNELTADVFYSPAHKIIDYNYDHKYFSVKNDSIIPSTNLDTYEKSNTDNDGYNLTLQTDYCLPINDNSKLETGYKTNIRSTDMDYKYYNYYNNNWILNNIITNDFKYDETTHALYAIYSDNFWNFKFHVGLRGEYTNTLSNQLTTKQRYKSDYFYLFPTVHIKYEISQDNSINLSITRRINRPSYKQLNPFVDYSDPQELSSGNPILNPEISNAYEIGYYKFFDKTALIFNVFYKYTTDAVNTIKILTDSNVVFSRPENLNSIKNLGTEFVCSQQFFKWLKIDGSVSYYKADILGGIDSLNLSASNYCWNSKLTLYIMFGKAFSIQVSSRYNSESISAQTVTGEHYSTDIGMKLKLFSNKLSVNLKFNDVLRNLNNKTVSNGYDFSISSLRQRDTRYILLGFTYTFNNYKDKNDKKLDEEEEEELQGDNEEE